MLIQWIHACFLTAGPQMGTSRNAKWKPYPQNTASTQAARCCLESDSPPLLLFHLLRLLTGFLQHNEGFDCSTLFGLLWWPIRLRLRTATTKFPPYQLNLTLNIGPIILWTRPRLFLWLTTPRQCTATTLLLTPPPTWTPSIHIGNVSVCVCEALCALFYIVALCQMCVC